MVSVQAPGARAQPSVTGLPEDGLTGGGVAGVKRRWNGIVPPRYQRCRLAPAPGRGRWWRRDAYIAIDEALTAGELPLHVASALRALLAYSDDTGKVSWPSLATIGKTMGGRSSRTAGYWLAVGKQAGWVECEHRCRRVTGGVLLGDTNLWRVVLPAVAQERLDARKARSRTETRAKHEPTPAAPQNRPSRAWPSSPPAGVVGERSGRIDPTASARSFVAALWRTGVTGDDLDDEIRNQFQGDELDVALAEFARLRAGP